MLFTLVIVELALCTPESSVVSFLIFSLIDGDIALLFLRGGACNGTLKKNIAIVVFKSKDIFLDRHRDCTFATIPHYRYRIWESSCYQEINYEINRKLRNRSLINFSESLNYDII